MPGGVAKTFIQTKEPELKGVFDEWLARIVCYAFSVSLSALRQPDQPLDRRVKLGEAPLADTDANVPLAATGAGTVAPDYSLVKPRAPRLTKVVPAP